MTPPEAVLSARHLPTPVQRPRVPVWVGGYWPAKPPMRRAARWDGAAPILHADASGKPAQPDAATVREISAFLGEHRAAAGLESEPFDLAIAQLAATADAEATVVTHDTRRDS